MKKILSLCIMALVAMNMFAQKDVTTFLGIPVDGTMSEMKQKLQAKGFTLKKEDSEEYFDGEFNGVDVHVFVVTNNNKVCRIMVMDATPLSEADIKIRFNNLVEQFENNDRYVSFEENRIPEDEKISYGMKNQQKNYDAVFYQSPNTGKAEEEIMEKQARKELLSRYTEEQLANPTEEMNKEMDEIASKIAMDLIAKKSVWFRISEQDGGYCINIFYDNEYNRANGEDL